MVYFTKQDNRHNLHIINTGGNSIVFVLTISNYEAYLPLESFFHKTLHLFQLDCEIANPFLEPTSTKQCEFVLNWNNGNISWSSIPRLTDYEWDALPTKPRHLSISFGILESYEFNYSNNLLCLPSRWQNIPRYPGLHRHIESPCMLFTITQRPPFKHGCIRQPDVPRNRAFYK